MPVRMFFAKTPLVVFLAEFYRQSQINQVDGNLMARGQFIIYNQHKDCEESPPTPKAQMLDTTQKAWKRNPRNDPRRLECIMD